MAGINTEENGVRDAPPQGGNLNSHQQLITELRSLVTRAKSGDNRVLPELRRFLASQRPLVQQIAELALKATEAQLELICGESPGARQAILARLAKLKSELTGSPTSELEGLLVDRILVCRLQLLHADLLYTHRSTAEQGQAKFFEQRLDRAHRRFGFAVKQLALVRKLLPRE